MTAILLDAQPMATDYIRYDLLTQQAMRGVIRTVLTDAAAKGLPGDHHFFITFDTHADGVTISQRLLAQYAEEMTIVLQHQFWDLALTDDTLHVGLSFNGIPERLVVPLEAIKQFVDPAAKFELQFAELSEAEEAANAPDGTATPPEAQPAAGPQVALASVPSATPSEPDKPSGGAEVVRLDRFRKK